MKFFRFILSAILLIALMGCTQENHWPQNPPRPPVNKIEKWLATLPGVHSVQKLNLKNYKSNYLIVFKQLLDPKNPTGGTFLQRVFLSHQDFDSPMVLETEGYNAEHGMTQADHTELTKRYQANRVVVEHRYSGLSSPSPRDWKYLTCENAAADLHAVRVALGTAYTSHWIATGASKGGTNTMSYMMYYPNDLSAAVAYVGPICNSLQDTRFVDHMLNVATPQMRQKIVDFQRQLLIRRNQIQPVFYKSPVQPSDSKETMTNDQAYEQFVVDLPQIVWQYGFSIDEIPATSATDKEIIDYLDKKVFTDDNPSPMPRVDRSRTSIGYYLRERQKHLSKFAGSADISNSHYYVQAQIELGTYAYTTKPLEDLIPNHKSWSVNTITRFVIPADAADIKFSDKLYNQMTQWLQSSDPRLICVYGEYDPWVAAAPDKTYFAGKANMAIFIEKGGSHLSKIETLAPGDKQQVWAKLDSWVKK